MSATPPAFDRARVLARLREGDEGELRRAYQRVFGHPEGRFVLAHILAEAGVGAVRGPNYATATRDYADGRADGALAIMNLCGFDQLDAAMTVLTDTLEGNQDERDQRHYAEPAVEF